MNFYKNKKMRPLKDKYYINKDKFIEHIETYYNTGIFSRDLADYIIRIADGISHSPRFINYTYVDEMRSDAILKMTEAMCKKSYNLDDFRKNPFGYFSMIAFHAFINRLKIEKKYRATADEYAEKVYQELVDEGLIDGHINIENPIHEND